MSLRFASIACILCVVGCKAPPKPAEMDDLLQTVSYETVVPEAPKHQRLTQLEQQQLAQLEQRRVPEITAESAKISFQERVEGVRDWTINATKLTGALLLYGGFKFIEALLAPDDDDDGYDYSARGRDDRNYHRWLKDREDWREDA